jgi:hypothetical protein
VEEEENEHINDEQGKVLSLEEIMNPFLDKGGAAFGAVIMAATLITVLVLNAVSQSTGEHPVFWVTLPAAFVMFCWDVAFGWFNRKKTREIARKGRQEVELARTERAAREQEEIQRAALEQETIEASEHALVQRYPTEPSSPQELVEMSLSKGDVDEKKQKHSEGVSPEAALGHDPGHDQGRATLVSLIKSVYRWSQETFPTVTAVLAHLPFALVPFAFCMFILVQALATKGWIQVFAHGWDHWVNKTGTVGAIGGMGFLSVILCNVSSCIHIE